MEYLPAEQIEWKKPFWRISWKTKYPIPMANKADIVRRNRLWIEIIVGKLSGFVSFVIHFIIGMLSTYLHVQIFQKGIHGDDHNDGGNRC